MRPIAALIAIILPVVASGDCKPLAEAERSAIEQVLDTYVAEWLEGDPNGVMATIASDAVLIPHHGLAPVIGEKAIRAWWWPVGAPKTTIHSFVMTHEQIGGSQCFAFARGTQSLEWTTGDKRSRNRGNHLTLLRKEKGQWRITHQMWGDPPNETVRN